MELMTAEVPKVMPGSCWVGVGVGVSFSSAECDISNKLPCLRTGEGNLWNS